MSAGVRRRWPRRFSRPLLEKAHLAVSGSLESRAAMRRKLVLEQQNVARLPVEIDAPPFQLIMDNEEFLLGELLAVTDGDEIRARNCVAIGRVHQGGILLADAEPMRGLRIDLVEEQELAGLGMVGNARTMRPEAQVPVLVPFIIDAAFLELRGNGGGIVRAEPLLPSVMAIGRVGAPIVF